MKEEKTSEETNVLDNNIEEIPDVDGNSEEEEVKEEEVKEEETEEIKEEEKKLE